MGTRLIDRDQRVRKKTMQVLVLGVCRTGTSSIRAALEKLGYTAHHMECAEKDPSQIPYWIESMHVTFFPDSERPAHLRGQPPYGRAEFDKLLADYDAVTDFPGALYAEQLVEAYPDAKVILTLRDYDSWRRSMTATIFWILSSKLCNFCRVFNISPVATYLDLCHKVFKVHNGHHLDGGPETKAAFERHYERVRNLVPKENLLEFGPKFTWEPLCRFLAKEVPDEPYPFLNDGKLMKRRMNILYAILVAYTAGWVLLPVGIAWVVYRWQNTIIGLMSTGTRRI